MQSIADLMEGNNGRKESRKRLSPALSHKREVTLFSVFCGDSLPKLTQGQLERLSQDSVNSYL